jgi:hypothetical protein
MTPIQAFAAIHATISSNLLSGKKDFFYETFLSFSDINKFDYSSLQKNQ